MSENNSIFRKQALDRISSPEELDHYLVVTRPGIWFVLAALIILIVGVLAWGVLGQLEMSVNVAVVTEDGQTTCLVPADSASDVLSRGVIEIAGQEYPLTDAGLAPQLITPDTDINICYAGGLAAGDTVLPLKVEAPLDDGVYAGEVVIEAVKPISFIIN